AAHRARGGARGDGARGGPPHRAGPRGGQGAAAARQGSHPVTKPKVRDLLERRGDLLQLEALTGDVGLDRDIPAPEASSPGLVLAGYTKRFAAHRIHILGETERSEERRVGKECRSRGAPYVAKKERTVTRTEDG